MINANEGRKVSLDEARKIRESGQFSAIIWRPESELPEELQYAVVLE